MYELIKTVIASKQYELSDMLKKIDIQWISGKITDEQREELIALAQENANISNSIDVSKKLAELDKRVAEVEKKLAAMESSDDSETEDTETEVVPEEYVPGKYYYTGDEMIFEGSVYVCTAPEGVVCVWSPVEYPPYWVLK